VPGRPADSGWGELPLVIDTSAWARGGHGQVREAWKEALLSRRFRLSPAVRFEILLSVREGSAYDALAEQLTAVQSAPLNGSVIRAAEQAMTMLAHRSAGTQRIPIVDYLVAAAAQELGSAVIHYDRDYDTLAEVMEFESIWLAPVGTLDSRN
jgi:predicted nucleic acid-binding protein